MVELAAARFRLYQSVTGLLRHVAAARPLLVVIDDLHWADTGSLELLAFLAAELRGARLVVLGTYRDVDLAAGQPRLKPSAPWPARGWWNGFAFVAWESRGRSPHRHHHREPASRTAGARGARPHRGQPVLRHRAAAAAPERRHPPGRRCDGCAPCNPGWGARGAAETAGSAAEQTNAVLLVAATAGRGFDLDLVQAVTQLDDEPTLDAVEAAVIAGLVVEDEEAVGATGSPTGWSRRRSTSSSAGRGGYGCTPGWPRPCSACTALRIPSTYPSSPGTPGRRSR